MQQKATNKFIENANNFGNSYEKQIANAFEEILENEEEIKESIQALYQGPKSFVKQAESDLEEIEEQYKSRIENFNDTVSSVRKKLSIVSILCCCICVGISILSAICVGLFSFFGDIAKTWNIPIAIIVAIVVIGLTIWLSYCAGKGSKY